VTEEEETAKDFLNFLEKSRNGEVIPPEVIIKYAKYFEDELTLDNMSRMQLINMCRYMGIPPYGADSLLRFQLRHRIRTLREDDQRIIWEGIDALTKMELREACQERGMRSIGLSKSAYKLALQQWLDLSVVKHVPISLLIMSRTFFLREEAEKMTSGASFADDSKAALSIADAISGLEKEVVNEVVLDVAAKSTKDHKDPEVVKIKLEVLQQQNELIKEEYEGREAKKKKKEEEEAAHVAAELAEQENETDDKQIVVDTDTIQIEAEVEKEPIESSISEKVDIVIKEEVVASELTEVVETEGEKESEEEDEEDEKELSAEEIEAISQLLSPNAVLSEREELERIKAAMAKNEEDGILDEETEGNNESIETDQESVSSVSEPEPVVLPSGTIEYESSDELDKKAEELIAKMDEESEKEAEASTIIEMHPESTEEKEAEEEDIGETPEKTKLDKSIARLQSKVDDMVGKIEIQLSDVEAKIGDKMHLLDKDNDGILTNEEIAQVLQQVLKRDLTFEEAMAIAYDMVCFCYLFLLLKILL